MGVKLPPRIIDGKELGGRLRAQVAARVAALSARGVTPGLAVVLVGEDPASQVYVRSKSKACREAGIQAFDHHLPATTSEAELLALVERLNGDDAVDGILVQLPLPKHVDAERVLVAIRPDKDVDGFHPDNVGRLWTGHPRPGAVPCTPRGVMHMLADIGFDPAGKEAVIIGRSNIVGRPMAALLLNASATVTICHSKSRDLALTCARAELLVAAVGKAEMVRGSWIRPGAVVIDVGINRVPTADGKGRLVGDVAYDEALANASAITPVPGGAGPMTIACLLENTVDAAQARRAL